MYTSITNTIECTRVVMYTDDPSFVAIKFYNNRDCIMTAYASSSDGKTFEFFTGIEAKDVTILLEETDAKTDSTE
jgi:hypothetical protein